MKKTLKTLLVSLLTAALLCCMLPAAFAADSKESEIHTIGLDAMGGTCEVVAVTTGLTGKLAAMPVNPVLDGYTFDGWYTEPVGGTKVTTATIFTGDTTVYAHWTVKSSSGSAAAPASPAQSAENPAILDHLGGIVVVGALFGTLAIAAMM